MRVLVTGVAGFIGSNVARALLALGEDVHVVGIDNMDPYYDVSLKSNRLAPLTQDPRFVFIKGGKIQIFNYGDCKRDFTYIDDIVEGVVRVMQRPPQRKVGEGGLPEPPYAVYNIGNSAPESLLDFVRILQEELVAAGVLPKDYDFQAHMELVPMQPGDVAVTYADTSALERDFGFRPSTSLRDGLRAFARWYALSRNVIG